MRLWISKRRFIVWFFGVVALIVITRLFVKQKSSNTLEIPILQKVITPNKEFILYGPFVSHEFSSVSDHSVTLVTHTSLKNLYKLQVMTLVWEAPVSVAVWAHGDITSLIELAYILTKACQTFKHISISILVSAKLNHVVNIPAIDWSLILQPDKQLCSQRNIHNRFYQLRALEPQQNYDEQAVLYPNNKLRNVALATVLSPYVMVIDIDILPSVNMDNLLSKFLHTDPLNDSIALVVPVFEFEQLKLNQWNLDKLIEQWNVGKVRPFYVETCPQCQGPTQYINWIARQKSNNISHLKPSLVLYKPGWEPFIVMNSKAHPKYDERFQQFGYNRMSLICELHLSGKQFYVIDKVFLMHEGFKTEEGFHAKKDEELQQNEKLYQLFRNELALMYGSQRTC